MADLLVMFRVRAYFSDVIGHRFERVRNGHRFKNMGDRFENLKKGFRSEVQSVI